MLSQPVITATTMTGHTMATESVRTSCSYYCDMLFWAVTILIVKITLKCSLHVK